jgi:hypothetical protein
MQQGVGIQEIQNQNQRNEEDRYIFVLRNFMNFHAEWNNGLTFKIGPGEVCATCIELPPWAMVWFGWGRRQHIVLGGFGIGQRRWRRIFFPPSIDVKTQLSLLQDTHE